MDSLIKTADPNFKYVRHETENGVMRIFVKSTRQEAQCPYCGGVSDKVHSLYFRKFRDLPIQDKKVEIVIDNRKFFCLNPDCAHKTFAESFECLPKMGRRSRRLTEAIMEIRLKNILEKQKPKSTLSFNPLVDNFNIVDTPPFNFTGPVGFFLFAIGAGSVPLQ
jgi:transposase